jgi:formamidopyrimidine-DNA glycosylase
MPELPEVETVVRRSGPALVGRRVSAFASYWARQVSPHVRGVRTGVVGRRIERVWRRAKFIVCDLDDGGHLLVHLRMSGRFEILPADAPRPRHARALWELDDGRRWWFCDARKFGRIVHSRDLARATASLGVEPLSRGFSPAALARLLSERARQIKPLLLDQSVIAGLGNIYADESLFRAGVHPLRRSDRLTPEEVRRLHGAIRGVLRDAIRRQGTTFDWIYADGEMQDHLCVYGRAGEPCPRCGGPIEALRVGQRGTHICRACQPRSPANGAGRC